MELRSLKKKKKRTWYNYRPFTKTDVAVITAAVILFTLGIIIIFQNGSRFWNPFLVN
jgi:energy-coupling factor transport system permease protein